MLHRTPPNCLREQELPANAPVLAVICISSPWLRSLEAWEPSPILESSDFFSFSSRASFCPRLASCCLPFPRCLSVSLGCLAAMARYLRLFSRAETTRGVHFSSFDQNRGF